MKNRSMLGTMSLAALAACSLSLAACGDKKPADSPATASANGNVAVGQQPGAYPQQQYPQQQPGAYPQQQYPQQQQPGAYPQQQYPQQQYPQQQQPGAYPQQPQQPATQPTQPTQPAQPGAQPQGQLGQVITTDPNQLAQMFQQAAAAGAALLQQPGAVAGDPIEAGIKMSAAKNAPGMQPEGQIAKGNLAENGHLEFMVPMQAGKCYAVVGFAMPGTVKNLDLHLLAPPLYNFLAGEDTTDDNMPVIGKGNQPMCPIVPIALNYKVDIHARKGAGNVGVQVYSKNK